jgi:hypothetical protein
MAKRSADINLIKNGPVKCAAPGGRFVHLYYRADPAGHDFEIHRHGPFGNTIPAFT